MIPYSDLQERQRLHDKRAHADIVALPERQRIAHLLAHLGKYVGRLVLAKRFILYHKVRPELLRTVEDALLITLSLSTICNTDLEQPVDTDHSPLLLVSNNLRSTVEWLQEEMAIVVGRMNKAYEDFDHDQALAYKPILSKQIGALMQLLEIVADRLNWDLTDLAHQTWTALEFGS